MRLPPTQQQGMGWETSASPSASPSLLRRFSVRFSIRSPAGSGERASIPRGEPAGRLRSAEEEARTQSREMTWQRSPGAGAEPGNSTGSPATPRHGGAAPALPPGALSGGTTRPGDERPLGTGVVWLLLFTVAIKFNIIEVMRARNWEGRRGMESVNWENQL